MGLRKNSIVLLVAVVGCGETERPDATPGRRAGGDTTVIDRTSQAFTLPAPNLDPRTFDEHRAGDAHFEAVFVTAPAPKNAGLGPLFNNTACGGCHVNNGRGMPVVGDGHLRSHMLVRVSDPTAVGPAEGGSAPFANVGTQLQDHAVFGVAEEASVEVEWDEISGTYTDGTPYSLRQPRLDIHLGDGSPLPAYVERSLRGAPPVFGLGLLEAVSEADLRALADPDDANGDGISGRVNEVWDPQVGATVVGRFGLKANTSTLHVQAAAAFVNDMGVTNPLFPADDGGTEVDGETVRLAALYTQTLGVPERARLSAEGVHGEALFAEFSCDGCHRPALRSSDHPLSALARQNFAPYTDLLLHDLGEGLADGRPDFLADGREWRTAPLWGIGLTQTVLPLAGFLHDGRARTLEEAILWHGGEAAASRAAFVDANAADRAALVAFLQAL